MPPLVIAGHLVLAALGWRLARRVAARPAARNAAGVLALAALVGGFAVERSLVGALSLLPRLGADLVFLTNLSLEAVAVLVGLLWTAAATRAERSRAALLGLPFLTLAAASYAWYFQPAPAGLSGRTDAFGLCLQTSEDSCTPAAAVILLHQHGIVADEAELARLCLTRARTGTSRLGLVHGLAVAAKPHWLRPKLVRPGTVAGLARLGRPAILTVGLGLRTPRMVKVAMARYGWSAGSWHTVVVLTADPAGQWLDVADPTTGRERWPTGDLELLWDGSAVVLTGPTVSPP